MRRIHVPDDQAELNPRIEGYDRCEESETAVLFFCAMGFLLGIAVGLALGHWLG